MTTYGNTHFLFSQCKKCKKFVASPKSVHESTCKVVSTVVPKGRQPKKRRGVVDEEGEGEVVVAVAAMFFVFIMDNIDYFCSDKMAQSLAAELDDAIWSDLCNGITGVFTDVLLMVRKRGNCYVYIMRDHVTKRSDEHHVVFERLSRIVRNVEFPDGVESLVKHHEILHLRYREAVVACNCVIDGI